MFIIGANAAGKSNLLDVFRFLKDVTKDGLQKSVNSRGGIKKLRYLNARNQNYIEIFVRLLETEQEVPVEWTYTLQFNSAGGRHESRDINIKLEKITRNKEVLEDRKYTDGDYLSNQFTYLEQPAKNIKYRALYESFRGISYVNIIPQLIRESDSFIPSVASEDFYGRNLLESISAAPSRNRAARLNIINKILKLAVPQFSDLEYTQDEKGRPHLQVKYEHFRPQGAYQREDQFSDGTLRLLGIIWAILDGPGVLLLEEPDIRLQMS
ncbi:MAG: ATP-binding protein [Lachnospiraceae bacterium]|nr:ATP-binding protein [Lachnospiraceae bacterium]